MSMVREYFETRQKWVDDRRRAEGRQNFIANLFKAFFIAFIIFAFIFYREETMELIRKFLLMIS